MAMDRWQPIRDMMMVRDAMERLFQDSIVRPASAILPVSRSIPVDIADESDRFVIYAPVPGARNDDVHITVQDDTVTIRSEPSQPPETVQRRWISREFRTGAHYRSITLPAPLDPDRAEARFERGMLVLSLPKAERARPRQIKVKPSVTDRNAAIIGANGNGPASTTALPVEKGLPKDTVVQASEESFPASDPPAWTSARDLGTVGEGDGDADV